MAARRYEQEFLLAVQQGSGVAEARARYATLWKSNISVIHANLAEMRRIDNTLDAETASRLAEIENGLIKYESGFDAVEEIVERRGFLDTGLEGALRQKAHEVEAIVTTQHLEPLVSLLQLRRHEKDFMLRAEEQYAAQFNEEEARFE